MFKKGMLLIALSLLLIQTVIAIDAGDNYELTVIPFCINDVTIKVRQTYNVDDYKFIGCKRNNNIWKCPCDKEIATKIIFSTVPETNNVYDIVVGYNLDLEHKRYTAGNLTPIVVNDDNVRTLNFNNLKVKSKEIKKQGFNLPSVSKAGSIVLVILFFVSCISIGGYFLFRKLFLDESNKIDRRPTIIDDDKEKSDEISYEDVEELVRNSS